MSITRTLVFFAVVTTISVAAHRYVFVRLVRDPAWSGSIQKVATASLVVLAFAPLVSMIVAAVAGRSISKPLSIVAMIWLGTMLYLLIGSGVSDVLRLALRAFRPEFVDGERRLFLARTLAGVVTVASAGIAGFGVARALAGPQVARIRVPLAKLSATKSGYRIVQITDVHVGPMIGREQIERLVADVNRLDPDLVAITGDLVDGSVARLREHVAPLGGLRAKDGVFFVTGNHEYYSGADEWIAHLATLGIRTLRNERVAIGGDDGFDLAGVDDFRARGQLDGHGPDLPRALEGRDRARPVVLLAHQPKQAFEAAELGVDLQLSGHTHAGQIRPFDWLVRLEQPFLVGLHRLGGTSLYVSPGTGFWGPPMRVGTTAEITELRLEAV